VRTLLLSATPYKLYTADAEIAHEDHYKDFLATMRFLMGNDEPGVDCLKRQLADFGGALKRAAAGAPAEVLERKTAVERTLRKFIARTERVGASEAQDAMVEEPKVQIELRPDDVRQYLAADALFRAVGSYDPMDLWKSAPYLANFMQGYKFNTSLDEALARSPERRWPRSCAVIPRPSSGPERSTAGARSIRPMRSCASWSATCSTAGFGSCCGSHPPCRTGRLPAPSRVRTTDQVPGVLGMERRARRGQRGHQLRGRAPHGRRRDGLVR
jgi:hypothetical protein